MYHATFVKGIGAFLLPTSFSTIMRIANGLLGKGTEIHPFTQLMTVFSLP